MKWKRVTSVIVMLVPLNSLSAKAIAADIIVSITNENSSGLVVFVYDLFGGAVRAVDGSPFSLAAGEMSPRFTVQSGGNGEGQIAYDVLKGPVLSAAPPSDPPLSDPPLSGQAPLSGQVPLSGQSLLSGIVVRDGDTVEVR